MCTNGLEVLQRKYGGKQKKVQKMDETLNSQIFKNYT